MEPINIQMEQNLKVNGQMIKNEDMRTSKWEKLEKGNFIWLMAQVMK